MNIGKPGKIALLAATLLPIVYTMLFVVGVVVMAATSFRRTAPSEKPDLGFFPIIVGMHIAVMLLSLGLVCFYIVYLFKTPRVANDKKALWAVVLFMGGFIAMPIFWYLYIWPESVAVPGGERGVPSIGDSITPEGTDSVRHHRREPFGPVKRGHTGQGTGMSDDE